jgi:hypothetical protein
VRVLDLKLSFEKFNPRPVGDDLDREPGDYELVEPDYPHEAFRMRYAQAELRVGRSYAAMLSDASSDNIARHTLAVAAYAKAQRDYVKATQR